MNDEGWVWWWKSRLPHRKGQPCKVLIQGGMNSILVEFEDGQRVVTSRYAVRKANSCFQPKRQKVLGSL